MTIITLTGKKIVFPFTDGMTGNDLKEYIFQKEMIPCIEQRLVYMGTELNYESNLVYDGENKIYLILKLRGGMFHESSGRIDNMILEQVPSCQINIVHLVLFKVNYENVGPPPSHLSVI